MIRVSIANTGKIYVTINDDGPIRIRMVGIEPIRINAFDYPVEIDKLTQDISETKQIADSAAELAELARTAASAAITEIAEHETEIENPHPVTTTQEFADTQITPLATEATYTPAVWAYLVGLFTTVPKSVLQQIVNIWAKIYDFEKYSYLKTFEISIDQLVSGEYFNVAKVAAPAIYTTSLLINRLTMFPITVSSDVSINSAMIRVYSGAPSSKIIVGIYEGNPFYPYSKIWSSNEIETVTEGIKNEYFSLTLRKNKVYWFAFIVNSDAPRLYLYQPYQTPTIKGDSLPTAYNGMYVNLNYGAMPTTLEGMTLINVYTRFPIISLRRA